MAEIVNLRMARKARARVEKEREAEQNRILHGRSRNEVQRRDREAQAAERQLDGHRRDKPGEPPK